MTNRINRVNSLLEKEIGQIISREISFPDNLMVTLTRVDATANLIQARVYISTLPETKLEVALKILNKSVSLIQHKINKKLNMRPIPKIMFVKDEAISKAGRIEELLGKLKEEQK